MGFSFIMETKLGGQGQKELPRQSSGSFFLKIKYIGEAIIFRHTLFSLPIAIAAILLESSGRPPVRETVLILLAAVAGRSAANAMNRVIDSDIDKKNPRTADRHLPAGVLSKKSLLVFSLAMALIVVICAAMLNWLCVLLLPAAAVMIVGYSFSKRFTWLCHYWLGAACAIAPMGAFIGLTGHFAFRYFILAGAHMFWVAGFDIIYARLDIEFDRAQNLYSVPARFGETAAARIAAASHLCSLVCYSLLAFLWNLSLFYYIAFAAAAGMLVFENLLARGNTPRHIKIASYTVNEIVPFIILAGTAAGVYL